MNARDVAIVIVALGTAGIPIVLIMFTVGGLLAGFAIWSVLNFLSQWMTPLLFAGAGAIALIELAPRGPKEALMGVVALGVFVFLGYFVWSGAFNGPSNTYSLFLSTLPSSQAAAPSGSLTESLAWLVAALITGVIVLVYAGPKIFEEM